jgi:hypothetical protein
MRKKLAPATLERIVPSIEDGLPPVTRLRIFWMLAGPENVATSPDFRSNWEKLWNRLLPRVAPSAAVML